MRRRRTWKALLLGSLSLAFVASEATFGVLPATEGSVLNVYNRTNTAGLDCYPTNPRGYFDLDLREPATRARFELLRVRRVEDCAAHAPHAVELRYNSLQFRDREPGTKRPGTRRVAVLGDSFTEGHGIWSSDSTWPAQLERELSSGPEGRPTEVVEEVPSVPVERNAIMPTTVPTMAKKAKLPPTMPTISQGLFPAGLADDFCDGWSLRRPDSFFSGPRVFGGTAAIGLLGVVRI